MCACAVCVCVVCVCSVCVCVICRAPRLQLNNEELIRRAYKRIAIKLVGSPQRGEGNELAEVEGREGKGVRSGQHKATLWLAFATIVQRCIQSTNFLKRSYKTATTTTDKVRATWRKTSAAAANSSSSSV